MTTSRGIMGREKGGFRGGKGEPTAPAPHIVTALPAAIEAEIKRRQRNRLYSYYPDTGPLRRDLYVKHLEFFAAGTVHRERLMLAANRVGKTEGVGAYETTLHLTGLYPKWWPGRRFDRAVAAWVCGDTNQTVRDILQAKLLGKIVREPGDRSDAPIGLGTGMIPGDLIRTTRPRQGIPDAVEIVYVKHISGGTSVAHLKSYEQGAEAYQGTEQDLIWLDEEPPMDVYSECLIRTMTTNGLIMLTFTPLNGMSDVVMQFLPDGRLAPGAVN